jgi:hypothetical protein
MRGGSWIRDKGDSHLYRLKSPAKNPVSAFSRGNPRPRHRKR